LKEFFERGGVKIYTLRKKEEPGFFFGYKRNWCRDKLRNYKGNLERKIILAVVVWVRDLLVVNKLFSQQDGCGPVPVLFRKFYRADPDQGPVPDPVAGWRRMGVGMV
jgi:hypothetical protein